MKQLKEWAKTHKTQAITVTIACVLLLIAGGLGIAYVNGAFSAHNSAGAPIEHTDATVPKDSTSKDALTKPETNGSVPSNSPDGATGTSTDANTEPATTPETIPPTEKPAEAESSGHTHTWKEHTTQRWVSNMLTVIDQPEQTIAYDIYRMYWYDTGTWEETRDPSRFDIWENDMAGGPLSPNSQSMVQNPEDCPLFKGYNDLGQPVFTGDHAIIGPYYETIPAVTHEEDHGHYETCIDYYYCDCGAHK